MGVGPHQLDRLTPREREIALLAASGASIRDLAATLVVSGRTVETHLVRIYRKLGLRSRSELVALVLHEQWAEATRSDAAADAVVSGVSADSALGVEVVRSHSAGSSFPPHSTNLPRLASSFVGRRAEVAEVAGLVGSSRLVTVVGVGGAGKTRLALQVAQELWDGSGEGVWLVELAALTDPDGVVRAVAAALGITLQPGRSVVGSLVEVLSDQHLLVVLDNCEHVIAACAQLAEAILRACPTVHLLATSREALGVDGERTFRIPPLSLPPPEIDGMSDLAGSEAAALFAERARVQVAGFAVSDGSAALVGDVCRRLDGLPLAIELAAARLRSMSLTEICGRLDQRFALLTGGSRTALPRQQTLAATVDWSYELLTAAEQAVLRGLSVFVTGFDLEAAESILQSGSPGGTGGAGGFEVADALGSLVDKSLVVADTSGRVVRYRLLETIRVHAADRLAREDDSEAGRLAAAHADYYLALAERIAAQLTGPAQVMWVQRMQEAYPNLRVAIQGLLSDPEGALRVLRLFGVSRAYWQATWTHDANELRLLDLALSLGRQQAPPQLQAAALLCKAYLHSFSGLGAQAVCAREAAELAQRSGDRRVEVEARGLVCYKAAFRGVPAEGLTEGREAVSIARELGDPALLVDALVSYAACLRLVETPEAIEAVYREACAVVERYGTASPVTAPSLHGDFADFLLLQGRVEEAREHVEIVLTTADVPGCRIRDLALGNLGWVLLDTTELVAATSTFNDLLRGARREGSLINVAFAVLGLACCACQDGNLDRAAILHGGAETLVAAVGGLDGQPTDKMYRDRSVAALRLDLGAGFDPLYDRGRVMTRAQIVHYALNHDKIPSTS